MGHKLTPISSNCASSPENWSQHPSGFLPNLNSTYGYMALFETCPPILKLTTVMPALIWEKENIWQKHFLDDMFIWFPQDMVKQTQSSLLMIHNTSYFMYFQNVMIAHQGIIFFSIFVLFLKSLQAMFLYTINQPTKNM